MSLPTPLLSVIVPVYNVAPYLEQCLDSILSQSYSVLEVIVVDDGSTDGSGAICDTYAERDARIRLIHQANAGLSAARNAAMDVMRGDFFVCVDSDDWLPEDALEQPMNVLSANPLIDILELGYTEINCRTGAERLVLAAGRELSSQEALQSLAALSGVTGMAWGKIFRTATMGALRFPVGRPYETPPLSSRHLRVLHATATSHGSATATAWPEWGASPRSMTSALSTSLRISWISRLPLGRPRPRPCRSCMRRSTVAS